MGAGFIPLINPGETYPFVATWQPVQQWLAETITLLNAAVREVVELLGAVYAIASGAEEHSVCSPSPRGNVTGMDTDSFPMHPTHAGKVELA